MGHKAQKGMTWFKPEHFGPAGLPLVIKQATAENAWTGAI
jgi:hypothetical protein